MARDRGRALGRSPGAANVGFFFIVLAVSLLAGQHFNDIRIFNMALYLDYMILLYDIYYSI